MRWSRIFAAIAVLAVVALVAGSAYAYVYLPEGTISVTPKDQSFSGLRVEINVITAPVQGDNPPNSSAGTSASLSETINGISIEAPLSEAEMAPATGARQVPRGNAQGTMHFANQTSLATFVPAGTQFRAPNGVIVQTTKGVNVPPTNLLGGTIGRGDAPLVANVEGPDGNLAAGQLTGVYGGNALQYTNSTLTGGTMQTIKVVTQADIDGLVTSLTAKVDGEKSVAIQGMVQADQQLITQTITLTNVQATPDRKAGEDGETVNVKVTATARAFVYRQSDMDDAISQAVVNWVRTPSNIPTSAGPQVWGNIEHDAPVLMSVDSETGHAIYTSNASATVKFTLTPDMDRQIRELVKGQEIAKAQQLIQQTYGGYLDAQSIQAKVLWFNIGKLPNDPAHIVVQLGSGVSRPLSQQQQKDNSPRPSQR